MTCLVHSTSLLEEYSVKESVPDYSRLSYTERMRCFGEAIDEIGNKVQAEIGEQDVARLCRLNRFSRSMEVVGRVLLHFSFDPITFLAGVGSMPYARFTIYNIIGGTGWVLVGTLSGYFFGNLPFVRKNFSLVILAIVLISLIPALLEYLRHRKQS